MGTAGSTQDADNWLVYPFLGSRLQNQPVYIPVTADGRIIDLARGNSRARAASFPAWLERLRQSGATEVVSFSPTSLELRWMEQSPDLFERRVGDGRQWGLYRLRKAETGD